MAMPLASTDCWVSHVAPTAMGVSGKAKVVLLTDSITVAAPSRWAAVSWPSSTSSLDSV